MSRTYTRRQYGKAFMVARHIGDAVRAVGDPTRLGWSRSELSERTGVPEQDITTLFPLVESRLLTAYGLYLCRPTPGNGFTIKPSFDPEVAFASAVERNKHIDTRISRSLNYGPTLDRLATIYPQMRVVRDAMAEYHSKTAGERESLDVLGDKILRDMRAMN